MDTRAAKYVLLALLLLSQVSLSQQLKVCYRIYYLFFPVADNCAEYKIDGNELIVEAFAKTVVLGKLVKPIHNWGVAISELDTLKPKKFLFYQREGSFKRDHTYSFYDGLVKVRITKYKKNSDKVERVIERLLKVGECVDPFTASVAIYRSIPTKKEGRVEVFYDGRKQRVDYRLAGEERIDTDLGEFNTWKVELSPKIATKGLLRPKGKWVLWIDKERRVPVKLKVSFVIGTAVGEIYKLEGNEHLLGDSLVNLK